MPDLSGKLAIVTGTRRSSDTLPDDEKARGMGAAGDEHPHENDGHRKRHRQHHCLTLLRPRPPDRRPVHQYRRRPSFLALSSIRKRWSYDSHATEIARAVECGRPEGG